MSRVRICVCAVVPLVGLMVYIRDTEPTQDLRVTLEPTDSASHEPTRTNQLNPGHGIVAGSSKDVHAVSPLAAQDDTFRRGYAAAMALRSEKQSVNFDSNDFIEEWLARDENLVANLKQFLTEVPAVTPAGPVVTARPEEILDRMAAIDALEYIAQIDSSHEERTAAIVTLGDIATRKFSPDLETATKRLMVAENFDALAALARTDTHAAFTRFSAMDSHQRNAIRPALLLGLADNGVPRDRIDEEFARRMESFSLNGK